MMGFAQTTAPKKAPPKKPAPASAPVPPGRWPIASLSVEGNRIYSSDQVLAVAGLKVGQTAGKAEFDAARDRLVSSGAFATVSYQFTRAPQGEGYAARFQVAEIEQVYPVIFEDLHVSTLDLQADLRAKDPLFSPEKLPATQPVLDRYTKWIEAFLTAKGVPEKVAGSVAPGLPGEYNIVFRPARALPNVSQIRFVGNKVVQQNVLREAISGTGVGAPFTEDSFRMILRASIRPIYEARGRLRVSFPELHTEPDKDIQGVIVTVTVNEGESYELGKVAFDGPTPVAPEALLKTGDFKTGEVANMDRVAEGAERIRKAVRHAGYLDAKVTSDRQIDDEKRSVNVTLHVEPGAQYQMGKLTLVGLDLNGEAEMLRIWTMKAGKPFNPDYPDLFLSRIREEGMFDNLGETKADTKVNQKDHTADVTLTFKGADPKLGRPGRRGGRSGGAFTQ